MACLIAFRSAVSIRFVIPLRKNKKKPPIVLATKVLCFASKDICNDVEPTWLLKLNIWLLKLNIEM